MKKPKLCSCWLIPSLLILLVACHPADPDLPAGEPIGSGQVLPTLTQTVRAQATANPHSDTATAIPSSPSPSPLPITPTPDPTRPAAAAEPQQTTSHLVQYGETLGVIAALYHTSIETLLEINDLVDADSVYAGQTLTIPSGEMLAGPSNKLVPDSELVYGPGYSHFDVNTFAARHNGYLVRYTETVEDRDLSGPEIVQLVAQRFSVGPRVLLALLELKAGWVTESNPAESTLYYPMGNVQDGWDGLFIQLSWTANQLSRGYYGWDANWLQTLDFTDGSMLQIGPGLNPGTIAVQAFLSQNTTQPVWEEQVAPEGSFAAVYRAFFGNPFQYAVEPLIPANLSQPEMVLPWQQGETWYLTGGPHGGWASYSGWAALDFVPGGDELGCYQADDWVRSISSGRVLRSENGEVIVDMDDDGFEGTGWVILYMHISSNERVPVGTWLEAGDKIGHPSCEGGFSNGTHMHVARRYNGRWIEADGPIPFVLDGWTAVSYWNEYDGALVKGDEVREACECRDIDFNGITRPRDR